MEAPPKQQRQQDEQQQTAVRKTEGVGEGGEEGQGRVLMTIELELTRKNGEEGPRGADGSGSSKAPGLLSRFANQLSFK